MTLRLLSSLATFALVLVTFTTDRAGADGDYPGHEVWLGLGGAASLESSIFNVPDDLESTPDLAITLGYMKNVDPRWGFGLHIYGAAETTPPVALVGPSGTQIVEFDLSTFNIGARGRYTFSRGVIAPYAFAGLNWANGSIDAPDIGELSYNGFSACVGPGASVALGGHFTLSAELFGSFGVANWESPPFVNSSGKEFDPSLMGGTANLAFVWGRRP